MKITNAFATAAALTIATVVASAANAAPLIVEYTPITDNAGPFAFNIDSNPTPLSDGVNGFVASITNATGQYAGLSNISFYNIAAGGLFGNYFGTQAYSGTTSMPLILTGTYTALNGNNVSRAGVVTISAVTAAVPEPATWAMMILGMGAVGYAMRRRIKVSEVNFTNHVRAIAGA